MPKLINKWAQKGFFKKPDNSVLLRVLRVICEDPNGIYAVKWLHLYHSKESLVAVESFVCASWEGATVAVQDRQYYSQAELADIERPYHYIDPTSLPKASEPTVMNSLDDALRHFDEWQHDVCACDGGHSYYRTRTVSRARAINLVERLTASVVHSGA
ncbi:hypothetical protein ABXZ88_003907 [Vibrio fluvialis]